MNAQEAILKIKALFEDNVAPVEVEAEVAPMVEETKVEMAEYSLMDGTKVEISALEIGGSVMLADGTPAPMGEHELMDGTSIQLDENGIIVEISSKEEDAIPEEDTTGEIPEDLSKEADKKMAEMAEQFEAKFAELIEAKEVAEKKVLDLENKVKQGFAQVAEIIEALSNVPTADPIQKPNGFSEFVSNKDMKEERLSKYRQALLNN